MFEASGRCVPIQRAGANQKKSPRLPAKIARQLCTSAVINAPLRNTLDRRSASRLDQPIHIALNRAPCSDRLSSRGGQRRRSPTMSITTAQTHTPSASASLSVAVNWRQVNAANGSAQAQTRATHTTTRPKKNWATGGRASGSIEELACVLTSQGAGSAATKQRYHVAELLG